MNDQDPQEKYPQFSPQSVLWALWKRKVWALGAWLVVSLSAAAVVFQLPVVYRAETVAARDVATAGA